MNEFDRTVVGNIGREPENRYAHQDRVGTPIGQENTLDQMVKMRENVNILHEMFTALEMKLAPVRYLSPQCCEKEMEKPRNGSEIRQALAEQNDRLMALRIRLNSLIQEIDL